MDEENHTTDDHEKLINQIKRKSGNDNEQLGKTLLASCVAALATFGFGYNMGFPSPVQHSIDTKSNKDGLLTDEQFSWFNVNNFFFFILEKWNFDEEMFCFSQIYISKTILTIETPITSNNSFYGKKEPSLSKYIQFKCALIFVLLAISQPMLQITWYR